MVRESQVNLFLLEFKSYAAKNFTFIGREKSVEAITKLGVTAGHVKEEIVSLTVSDFFNGPTRDKAKPSDVFWEFGKRINGVEHFIRLKVVPHLRLAVCQSFHPCEKPIRYPFKKKVQDEEGSGLPTL